MAERKENKQDAENHPRRGAGDEPPDGGTTLSAELQNRMVLAGIEPATRGVAGAFVE